jgi:hypothetical protein
MIEVEDLAGLWARSLLAFPDGRRDTATRVAWLQGPALYADLRQPPDMPDFSHAAGLNDLTAADCGLLARQHGFAGILRPDGDCVEWVREIDFQPPGPVKDIGRLRWEGDVLIEQGRDVEYLEHWHRDAALRSTPRAGWRLMGADGRIGCLIAVAAHFIMVRDRACALPAAASLGGCLTDDINAARAMVDCEISFGAIDGDDWLIAASTLPFRVGDRLCPLAQGEGGIALSGRDAAGAPVMRGWRIISREGNTSAFINENV